MRPGGALLALLASLLLLLMMRLLSCPTDAPARARILVEESRADTHGTSATLRTLRSPATQIPRTTNSTYLNENSHQLTEKCKNLQNDVKSLSNKTKGYSERDYLEVITSIQSCPWKRQAEEYENFRAKLASCCDAIQNFVVSQNNTPIGTNMSYEVESKKEIPIRESIFHMFPVSQPFAEYPYNQCAVVGNGGILNNSLCGAEIDKSDFVFRCNLPPTTGNMSKDVGSKTNLVTVNPSIITTKYGNLKEKKAAFLEDIATYGDAFLLLPAFSFQANTGASFKVYHTLKESKARQKVLFFHPKYLKHLALFWKSKGVTAFRLSTGLMITSVAVELCENVKLYGFWPFSKTVEDTPVNHHYYDNKLPKRGFHQMPKEYSQILQLHVKGILKVQFSKCEVV
ncbi:alpha-2,8-sialyltransferase 8F isoform X2 [Cavia porcellus]|uniref:ST8 alpha-N-acetyl-neuraminide alpha-2,8-sialyltransferase 6 n=1 Tax=Cavia porcellus TaxID=10141 RepID=H0VRZ3_CAVPO|nr:alpha-2,8-sialyltransferase 8F isoform X2 [Cavia porcellus]